MTGSPREARPSEADREQPQRVVLVDRGGLDCAGVDRAGVDLGTAGTEAAETAGVREARKLWRSLGFPDAEDVDGSAQADETPAGETPAGETRAGETRAGETRAGEALADEIRADEAALSRLLETIQSESIDFETAVRLTRAVGQTTAKLADWQVAILVASAERLEPTGRGGAGGAVQMLEEIGGRFEQILVHAWRRHLAAALARTPGLSAGDDEPNTVEVTVGFADLVGFTALSNEIGEDRLADLVETFETRCSEIVGARRGRVIKTLGDSVLFIGESTVGAVEIALSVVRVIGNDKRLPDVHVGLATGPVALRFGDVFGPPVNMAARLVNVARRNRVIVDQATADLLPADTYDTRALPARPIRGFGVAEPVAVRRLRKPLSRDAGLV